MCRCVEKLIKLSLLFKPFLTYRNLAILRTSGRVHFVVIRHKGTKVKQLISFWGECNLDFSKRQVHGKAYLAVEVECEVNQTENGL